MANKLEGKLRKKFDVISVSVVAPHECQISAKIGNRWITVCRFAVDEELNNILTMFEVNYEIVKRNFH